MLFIQHLGILRRATRVGVHPSQQLWTYVSIAFNKVDTDRLQSVGPDRLCAEWVLKNAGAVRFVQSPHLLLRDYNALPPESVKLNLEEIDATNSTIMRIGLEHLKNCKFIDRVIFHSCKHLESDGLKFLPYIKDTLKHLQVSSCDNIADDGLMVIKEMTKLESLRMFDMRYVVDMNKVVSDLKPHLPKCTIKVTEK